MGLHSSVGRASHRYRWGHGFECRWSPDFFQASSFQLLKLKNLLRRSLFTLVYILLQLGTFHTHQTTRNKKTSCWSYTKYIQGNCCTYHYKQLLLSVEDTLYTSQMKAAPQTYCLHCFPLFFLSFCLLSLCHQLSSTRSKSPAGQC